MNSPIASVPFSDVAPQAIAHVMQRVNDALQTQAQERGDPVANREDLELELNDALTELENIKAAIRKLLGHHETDARGS